MDKRIFAGLFGCLLSATATASLIYDPTVILLSGQGFGNAPRDLTIQETGPGANGVESGCVGVSTTGAIIFGSTACGNPLLLNDDAVIAPNGLAPAGGDEPNPLADNAKYGIPTLGSLGITSANQIGILFNATEPGGDSANVTDITLNFFSSTGGVFSFLTSIDGQNNFPSTNPGNGVAGFVFIVDATQQVILNNTVFNQPGFGNFVLSLNSTIADIDGGPETFRIVNLGSDVCTGDCFPQQIPEPGTLALLGIALLGGLATFRRRSGRNRKAA